MATTLGSSRTVTAVTASAAAGPTASGDGRRPRVAVVGAGYAGLAAALTLQSSGSCDVVVLEAGSRAGGRACTQQLSAELALEMGATWFHGLGTDAEPNPVFRHALAQGLMDSNPEGEQWWSSQFLLPGAAAAEPLSKEQRIAITHTLAAWGDVVEELSEDASGTTADHLQAAWQQLLASGRLPVEQLELAQRAWRWRELLQRAMDGCDSTAVQSAQGLALYDEMPGGKHCALPAGMQTVAERLAAQLPDVRYLHAVQHIAWGGTTGGLLISCASGACVEADVAIVTVSLGVLQAQHRHLFQPPLPAAKAAAIERLSIGTVDKVFLDFTPAGSSNGTSDGGGSSHGPAAAAAAGAAAAGAGSSSSQGPVVSYALLWDSPWQEGGSSSGKEQQAGGTAAVAAAATAAAAAAAEAQLPDWVKGIFSIRFGGPEVKLAQQGAQQGAQHAADVSGTGAGGTDKQEQRQGEPAGVAAEAAAVSDSEADNHEEFSPCAQAAQPSCYQAVAWVTGEAALALEAASDGEVLGALRQLAALYPQMQLPPGASWDAVKLYRSRWGSDPLFRGSYSYMGPGATPADVAALAAPIYATSAPPASGAAASSSAVGGDAGSADGGSSGSAGSGSGVPPLLLFAGEACQVKYIGTMHGAYLTGQQQAELLLQHFQQKEQQQEEQQQAGQPPAA